MEDSRNKHFFMGEDGRLSWRNVLLEPMKTLLAFSKFLKMLNFFSKIVKSNSEENTRAIMSIS